MEGDGNGQRSVVIGQGRMRKRNRSFSAFPIQNIFSLLFKNSTDSPQKNPRPILVCFKNPLKKLTNRGGEIFRGEMALIAPDPLMMAAAQQHEHSETTQQRGARLGDGHHGDVIATGAGGPILIRGTAPSGIGPRGLTENSGHGESETQCDVRREEGETEGVVFRLHHLVIWSSGHLVIWSPGLLWLPEWRIVT